MTGNPVTPGGLDGASRAPAGTATKSQAARKAGHGTWTLGTADPAAVVAEARKALFVMVGFLAVLWLVQIANWADHYQLTASYGIRPRQVSSLPDLLTAPFLHFSWAHIEGNSGPLLIFGFLAAYRGVRKFAGVTILVILASGLAAWLTESPHALGAGASGVVFGYFGYIMVRGLFDRHAIDVLIGAVMALCFAYQFTVLLPQQGVGWQAHIGGLAGGILAGWVFRDRRSTASGRAAKTRSRQVSAPDRTVTIAPDNPRAQLHQELDDLGL